LLAAGRHKMIEAILCNAAIKIEQSDIGETNEDMHSHGG
jgi:hypothetical protein